MYLAKETCEQCLYIVHCSESTADWLSQVKYMKFVREVRKRGEMSCLKPSLMWSVEKGVMNVAEITLEQALKLADADLVKTLAQVSYKMNSTIQDISQLIPSILTTLKVL